MMDIVFYETWFTVNKGKINRRDEGLLVKKKDFTHKKAVL